MPIQWTKRPTQLNTAAYAAVLRARVVAEAEASAARMEAYARLNAPWQDQTGDARAGLVTEVAVNGAVITITVAHSVDYGKYLELRWPTGTLPATLDGFDLELAGAGKYAIIWPTMEAEIPQFRARLVAALGAQ